MSVPWVVLHFEHAKESDFNAIGNITDSAPMDAIHALKGNGTIALIMKAAMAITTPNTKASMLACPLQLCLVANGLRTKRNPRRASTLIFS